MDFKAFLDALRDAGSIAITAPAPPDGDSVGAQAALKEILEELLKGKKVRIVNEDPCPKRYCFLKEASNFEISKDLVAKSEEIDTWICVDGGPSRIGPETTKLWAKAKKHLLIDHHAVGSTEKFAAKLYDPVEAATTMLVFKFLKACGATLSSDVAQAIYVGLIYDTGLFKHSNTTPEVMRVGAELLEADFNHTVTAEKAMLIRTPGNIALSRVLFDNFQEKYSRQIAWSCIELSDWKKDGISTEDKEGLIDFLFLTPHCQVAVLFFEAKKDLWKLSFRSRGPDVAAFARSLNPQGGGHKLASGVTLEGNKDSVLSKTLEAIEKILNG